MRVMILERMVIVSSGAQDNLGQTSKNFGLEGQVVVFWIGYF